MKSKFVRDLQPNEVVTDFFAVQSKEVRFKRNGDPYLSLVLGDRTGKLDAKMWDGVEEVVEDFERDDVVKIRGVVQLYHERPQLTIQKLRRGHDSEYTLFDYLPRTEKDVEEMFASLRGSIEAFSNPDLKRLCLAFLDDEAIVERLKVAPAAKSLHHAFLGGLLEHVCSLMNLSRLAVQNYAYVDLELVQTGVLLHDLGKIYEFSYDRSFQYTAEGQLLGHMTIVLRLLDRKCQQLEDFPEKLRLLVEHLILSHHGKYEFGSPKLPMFPEALMLHYLDDLDSKLESMRASVAADRRPEQDWTSYNPSLERTLLKKEQFLDESGPVAANNTAIDRSRAMKADPPPSGTPHSTRNPASRTPSLFGEKLQSALEGEPSRDDRA